MSEVETVVTGNGDGRWLSAAAAVLVGLAGLSGVAFAAEAGGIPDDFRDAEHLLTVLETADEGLHTLKTLVRLDTDYGPLEGNEKQQRLGTLYFSTGHGDAQRGFRVDFTVLKLPSEDPNVWVQHDEAKSFIFDGQRLAELSHEQKFAQIRRVAGPEEEIDPLAIGEGPFPIPIGQKKAEILRRFDATLKGPEDGLESVAPLLTDTLQLVLVPKEGTEEARDFKEVRIWYARHDRDGDGEADFLLPRQARTVNTDDSSAVAMLAPQGLTVNEDLAPDLFSTDVPEGWESQETDLRRAGAVAEEREQEAEVDGP